MPVNLLGLPVATQQTTQDPHAAHPGQLLRHTSVGCTLSLTWGDGLGRHVNYGFDTDDHTQDHTKSTIISFTIIVIR